MRSQDLGKAPSPALEGGTEGSASATTAMAKASLEAPGASQKLGGFPEDREGKTPPVSLGVRDARIANALAPRPPQELGKAPSPALKGDAEVSPTATAAMAKASLEAPGASQKLGGLPEDREGKAPPVSLGARDAGIANALGPRPPQELGTAPSPIPNDKTAGSASAKAVSEKVSLGGRAAPRKLEGLPEERGDARPAAPGGKKLITSGQGATASVPVVVSQRESGVAKADLPQGGLPPVHGLGSREPLTPPGPGKALPLGVAAGRAGVTARAPLGVSTARQAQAPIGVQAVRSPAGREFAAQGIARPSGEALEPRLLSQQQPGDLGTPGLSTPDSGQPAATPFTPGLAPKN